MLSINNLTVHYGQALALENLSLEVSDHGLTAVIGPNGAGKTTLLKSISRLVNPTQGDIQFEGRSIMQYKAHQMPQLGLAHCPEGRKPFSEMSVLDNLLVGGHSLPWAEIPKQLDKIFEMFPRLAERRYQQSVTLSGGEQQMLAIGRALMIAPKILLIDEPSLGLAPVIVDQVEKIIHDIKQSGVAVLMVEGNIDLIRDIADHVYVFDHGESIFDGTIDEILDNPNLSQTYLGM
ncbi:MAG: ABC transporter ATP-binding protein [Desulfarculaceae bacterium]|jgi:branched-chain amino acid transport system ATP-binding protein